jgi:signal transduction histidine kinase
LIREGTFSGDSASYTLSLYPSGQFYDRYRTNNPLIVSFGAIGISLFVSFMFYMYDSLVRHDICKKKAILDARRQFMRFVCHEVRTPLNTVCMGLKLMEEETKSMFSSSPNPQDETRPNWKSCSFDHKVVSVNGSKAASIFELSEQIHTNADKAVDILNDLLNYDKIERGQLTLERTVIPIWTLIERTMKEFKLQAGASRISFSLDFQSLLPDPHKKGSMPSICGVKELPKDVKEQYVVGDIVRMTQVLRNLVSNALKFTPQGGTFSDFV